VGSSGPAVVYLNGQRVYANAANRAFRMDNDLVPVTLQPGPNRLLARLETERGRWRFALRFLTQAQVETIGAPALLPALGEMDPDGVLSVAADSGLGRWIPDAEPVRVEAVAPGGKVVGKADTTRGGAALFHAAKWKAGRMSSAAPCEPPTAEPSLPMFPGTRGTTSSRSGNCSTH